MKIDINSSSPLTLAVIRFLIAGLLMITVLQIFSSEKLPTKSEWLKITIFGLLNITVSPILADNNLEKRRQANKIKDAEININNLSIICRDKI